MYVVSRFSCSTAPKPAPLLNDIVDEDPARRSQAAEALRLRFLPTVEAAVRHHLRYEAGYDKHRRDEAYASAWHALFQRILPSFTDEHAKRMSPESFVFNGIRRELHARALKERSPLSGAGEKSLRAARVFRSRARDFGYDADNADQLVEFGKRRGMSAKKISRRVTLATIPLSLNATYGEQDDREYAEMLRDDAPTPSELCELNERKSFRAETLARTLEILERLPATQSRVIKAKIFQNRSFTEIAGDENVTPGSIAERFHRAIARLRRELSCN